MQGGSRGQLQAAIGECALGGDFACPQCRNRVLEFQGLECLGFSIRGTLHVPNVGVSENYLSGVLTIRVLLFRVLCRSL